MALHEEITNYGGERGIHAQAVQRWLALGEADQNAMLRLARNLRLGGNHFNDFLDWCVEISLRDGCSIASVIEGEELAPTLSDSRMGRNDRLKHAKEALRRLRYPRLTRVEDEIRRRLRSLKLDPRIRITVAPGLEGGLKIELQAGGLDALARLARGSGVPGRERYGAGGIRAHGRERGCRRIGLTGSSWRAAPRGR